MLQSISWQEFFAAIGLAVVGYYFITGLLLYSNEIISLARGKSPTPSGHSNSERTLEKEINPIIGAAKSESSDQEIQTTVSAEQVLVSESRIPEDAIDITSSTITVADEAANLSSEIEALARIVSQRSREESVSLFQSLISRYASLVDTDHVERLSQFLHDKVAEHTNFQYDIDEIRGWWSMADERIKYKSK